VKALLRALSHFIPIYFRTFTLSHFHVLYQPESQTPNFLLTVQLSSGYDDS